MRQQTLLTRPRPRRVRRSGDLIAICCGLCLGALLGVAVFQLSAAGAPLEVLAQGPSLGGWFSRTFAHNITQKFLNLLNLSQSVQAIARSTTVAVTMVLSLVILMVRPLSHFLGGGHH